MRYAKSMKSEYNLIKILEPQYPESPPRGETARPARDKACEEKEPVVTAEDITKVPNSAENKRPETICGQDLHTVPTIPEEEVCGKLEVDSGKGLSNEEARERLYSCGANVLTVEKGPSAFGIFLRQFQNLLIIILIIAAIISGLAGELIDTWFILVIVLLSAGLGFFQEYRAERAVDALRKMLSPQSNVIREGVRKVIPSSELVPGDILILETGDRVPADARLLEAYSHKIDESSLTGESVSVDKSPCVLKSMTNIAEQRNMIFSGTVVTHGTAKAVVVATGMETQLGRIAREVGRVVEEKTPLERRTEEIGRWLGALAFSICFIVAGVGIIRQSVTSVLTMEFVLTMMLFAVALAVAAVPEALAGIVTGSLAIGMREMAKRKAIVRRMPAVETLGSVTVICSDKTGTITRGEMTVQKVYVGKESVEVSGIGYKPEGDFRPGGDLKRLSSVMTAGILCNDSDLVKEDGSWSIQGDPTEGSFLVVAVKAGMNIGQVRKDNPRIDVVPFSSERKLMTTIHHMAKGGTTAFMKGAPENVLKCCSSEKAEAEPVPLDKGRRREILDVAEGMAADGLRVLGLAMKNLESCPGEKETDMTFLGLVGMIDPPREEAAAAVNMCREVKITPVMITGDHKLTAMAVAREVGIFQEGDLAMTGTELEEVSDEQFEEMVEKVKVYARVSPMDKLRIVTMWKNHGHIVAMTGDGVNDAPALKTADIGIAMGITGTEVTKEASDMILADDNFATIIQAVEKGRWIYDNIKKYLTYLLQANLIEVVLLGGIVLVKGGTYMPLFPAAILFINVITDGMPAIALGIAPPDPDIMARPPRDPHEKVFSPDVLVLMAVALFAAVPFFYWVFLQYSHDLVQARTELFLLFIFVELLMALNFRSLRFSVIKVLPHTLLVASVVLSGIVTVIAIQFSLVREAFGITLPDFGGIIEIIAITLWVTMCTELAKMYLRKKLYHA